MGDDNSRLISRRAAIKAGVAIGTAGFAGCLGGDDSNNGSGLDQVNLAVPHFGFWHTTRLIAINDEHGFFEDEGIELNRVDTSGGGANVRTVVAGDADLLIENGIFGAFASYREGADIRIPSSTADPSAADLYWFSQAGSEYESLEDCDGASIGFSSPGSSTHMVSQAAISHAGIDAETVSAGGPADNYSSVLTGEIDLGWGDGIQTLEGIDKGEIQQVFRGDEIPPYDNLTLRTEVTSAEWLENESDVAESFFRAQKQSMEWEWENTAEAAELWAPIIDHDDPELLATVIEESHPGSDPGEIVGIETAVDLAVEHEFIDEPMSDDELDELVDLSYVPDN